MFTKGARPTSVAYPNGRLVHAAYGAAGSISDAINRLATINDDNSGVPGQTLAAYQFLGLGQMVIEDFMQPQVRLDYFGGTSGTYAGFDAFDRIVAQRWTDYITAVDVDLFGYGFDRNSNRSYRSHDNATTQDELYAYDDLLRLASVQRGTLDSGHTGIVGTPAKEYDFTFDTTGNWPGYVEKTAGTTDLAQIAHQQSGQRDHRHRCDDGPDLARAGLRRGRQHDDGPESG